MMFGYHIEPPLAGIHAGLRDLNGSVFQTYLRNSVRLSKEGVPDAADQEAYLANALAFGKPVWGMAHASLISNLASTDPKMRNGTLSAVVADANLASTLGLAGVCVHVGYEKGHASRAEALALVARKILEGLPKLKGHVGIWLENGCENGELGDTVEELGELVRRLREGGADETRFGVVLDTCHLHVAGFDLAGPGAGERLADAVDLAGLSGCVRALHLNDAREACGSRRDRHAIPGTGTIGEGLRSISQHPLFMNLNAILEMSAAAAQQGIKFLEE